MITSNPSVSSANTSLEGNILRGTYRLDQLVGKGGMAWVYQAYHLGWQQSVAVKVLLSQYSQHADFRERFLREASVQHWLQHPHIVRVLEYVEEQGILFIVMEWIEGMDLNTLLTQQGGRLSLPEIAWIFPKLAEAVGYAHQCGIVHRDLKPGNIMLLWQNGVWTPKVADFGVAKLAEESGLTKTGQQLGTPSYMSPEQWQDSKRVDYRADIYGLGIILYRMVTGSLPFQGNYAQLLWQVLNTIPDIPGYVPVPWANVIHRCLAKEPSARYASCAELADAFAQASSMIGVMPQPPSSSMSPTEPHQFTERMPALVSSEGKDRSDAAFQATHVPERLPPNPVSFTPSSGFGYLSSSALSAKQGIQDEAIHNDTSWQAEQATRIDQALRRSVDVSFRPESISGVPVAPTQEIPIESAATYQMPVFVPVARKRTPWVWFLLLALMLGGIGFYVFWR